MSKPITKNQNLNTSATSGLVRTIPSVQRRRLVALDSLSLSVMSAFDEAFEGHGTYVTDLT